MKSGQFVIGMIDGIIRPYQTDNVEKLLSEQEFSKLWKLGKTHGPGTYTYTNSQENIIARSVITEEYDGKDTGRRSTLNHTVIIKFDPDWAAELLKYTNFGANLNQPLPELKNPLPEPEVKKC